MEDASLDFRLIFYQTPALLLLLSPDEPFAILDASDAYLAATLTRREDLIGRTMLEAFPPNPADPSSPRGLEDVRDSLRRVAQTRQPDELPVHKYDIRRPADEGGQFEERFWSPANWPILDGSGKLVCLLHKVRDATEQVLAERGRKEAEHGLEQAEMRYRSLVEHVPAITFTASVSEPLQLLFVSPQVHWLGISADHWRGDPECYWQRLHPDDVAAARQAWEAFRRDDGKYDSEYRFVRDDGAVLWLRAQASRVANHSGAGFVQGIITDITAYKRIEGELRAHRDRLEEMVRQRTEALEVVNRRLADDVRRRQRAERALFTEKQRAQFTLASICDAVVTVDGDGRVDYLNPAAEAVLGKKSIDIVGRSLVDFLPLLPMSSGSTGSDLVDILAIGGIGHEDVHFFRSEDDERILELSSTALYDSTDMPTGAVIVFRDVTEERRRLHRLAHRARHDSLTGLPNRLEFERRLSNALESCSGHGASHALMFIDLDGFKRVNDTGGHAAGDEMLRQLAKALGTHLRERDTLARVGGDEFACLLEHCGPDNGMDAARALLAAVRKFSLVWEGQTFSVGASIGLVPLQGGGLTVEDVMQAADAACYSVKAAGRNDVCVRAPRKGLQLPEPDGWAERLAQALADNLFELVCQPIQALSGDPGHACEVLLRLRKDGEVTPAAAFMPSAERHGIAAEIDRWVVRQTISTLARAGDNDGRAYFINLSSATLEEGSMGEFLEDQLLEFKLDAGRIGFDIPESALMQHFRDAAQFIAMAKSLGCRIALDEFATALPAAPALKALHPDLVKISGRLVEHLGEDDMARAMVDAANRIGHAMGGATVAKFPANEDAMAVMRGLGIDHVQGNLVGAPQPLPA